MMDTVMKNEAFTLNINKMFELSEWKGAKDENKCYCSTFYNLLSFIGGYFEKYECVSKSL